MGTPAPAGDSKEKAPADSKQNGAATKDSPETAPAPEAENKAAPELPQEVRQKLRKLERLEPKYSGTGL
jgi:hypothetical protein